MFLIQNRDYLKERKQNTKQKQPETIANMTKFSVEVGYISSLSNTIGGINTFRHPPQELDFFNI